LYKAFDGIITSFTRVFVVGCGALGFLGFDSFGAGFLSTKLFGLAI